MCEKDKTVVRATFRSFLDPLSYITAIVEAYLDSASQGDLLMEQKLAFSEIRSIMDQHQRELPLIFHVLINLSVELLLQSSLAPL